MQHLNDAQLNEYVDGVLGPEAEASAEEHVRSCESCAADVAALRRLLASAAALPLSLEAPVHLWSAVRRNTIDGRFTRLRLMWELRVPLAAAAVLLVTAASLITYQAVARDGRAHVARAVPEAAATATMGLARAEADYIEAARTLLLVLDERRSTTDPIITQAVEENLRVIDREIGQAKAALAADSLNRSVAAILNATYQHKVQMLRRAVRLTGET